MLRPSTLPPARAHRRRSRAVVATLLAMLAPLLSVATIVAATGPSYADAATGFTDDQPLVVHIGSITPDYIPDHGPVVVTGTVSNVSTQTWSTINVHGFVGATPITSAAELADAAQTPVEDDVGHRITEPGTFDTIEQLAPGEVTSFRIRLPRDTLPVSAAGVYWFGVHVLATDPDGIRSLVARDRTFVPLVPDGSVTAADRVDTALVVPLRAGVTREADGTVADTAGWRRSMGRGALHSLVEFGRAAGHHPLTWVIDPAVVDAVRQLAAGNPARTLGSDETTTTEPSASPSPSDSATTSGSGSTAATGVTRTATRWLKRLHRVLRLPRSQLLGLPYGDVDVGAATSYDVPFLRRAVTRTGDSLSPWSLPLGSVVAPPSGRISTDTLARLSRSTTVLLNDAGVSDPASSVIEVDGRQLLLASTGAASGGPGPVDPLSAIALRQRILCEAALRALDGGDPLVVELPAHWHHLASPRFFRGLTAPWLRLTTLGGVSTHTGAATRSSQLTAPADSALDPTTFLTADRVTHDARTLQSILRGDKTLAGEVFDEAATTTSYDAAKRPALALSELHGIGSWLSLALGSIHLQAPESVTLASANGRFSAVVSNDLDVPVTVTVDARADSGVEITGGETVVLPPHGRTPVLLKASTHALGVHTVTLELTNAKGVPLGSSDQFPMRAEQVSRLIWVIIGAGLALLFGAIVVRLVRRLLRLRKAV